MSILPMKRRSTDDIPDPADIDLGSLDPEFGRLHALQQRLYARQVELNDEAIALARRIRAEGSKSPSPGLAPGVARLLGRDEETSESKALNIREGEIQAELRDLKAALAELDAPVHQARSRASFAACMQLKPAHDQMVSEMADALRRVASVQDRLCRFYRELDAAGIQRGSLPTQTMPANAAGGVSEWLFDRKMRQTFVDRWFQHAKRSGHSVKE
jgi:hypothetical protein